MLKGRCQRDAQDMCHRRATHARRSAVTPRCGSRSRGHLEASCVASVHGGRVHSQRPNTCERRSRTHANAYARQET